MLCEQSLNMNMKQTKKLSESNERAYPLHVVTFFQIKHNQHDLNLLAIEVQWEPSSIVDFNLYNWGVEVLK